MRKNFIKGLALGMAVCLSVVGCGTNSSSQGGETTTEGKEDQTTTEAGTDETTTEAYNNPLYPAYDFGNITLTILKANVLGDRDPSGEEDEFKKAEKEEWIAYIEGKYNVNLEFVDSPAAEWSDTPQELVNAYTAGKPVADVMALYYNWLAPMINNDVLYDMTDFYNEDTTYKSSKVLEFVGKKWGLSSAVAGEGLYYNKDMIAAAGMEFTPAEMFDRGEWDYDNFYNYLVKLQSNLGEGQYALYVDPFYWTLFATAGNGVDVYSASGELSYTTDAFIETATVLETLLDEGLCAIPDSTGEGSWDSWNYPANNFDNGTNVAIAHRAAWQAAGVVNNFDLGFVPYPWGTNVTIETTGEPGAYLTLSDNYKVSYYDGQVITFIKGIEEKADPAELTSMICELAKWDSFLTANEEAAVEGAGWLEAGSVDADLYAFSRTRERCEFYNTMRQLVKFYMHGAVEPEDPNWYRVYYQKRGLRANLESAYQADMAALREGGYVK